ncbi:uncharacterized protein LOC111592269 [Drosophila hydei]|uniref:Uncharacterized protein LOC111592269 n=1 Tax=Drosophila hydei TaxID=7224 RepID=A0A6J1L3B6_DROHY|nr:uncharacterized protein LOC111592269 [Drosophila hydei]
MFKLMPIDHQLCLLAYSYRLRLDECRQSPDHMDIYKNQVITMHRLLILSCLLGVIKSLVVFVGHYCTPATKLTTLWCADRFLILPPELTRNIRCVFGFIHLNIWLVLSYAAVCFSPTMMMPWLIYYYFLLAFRLGKFGLQATINNLEGQRMSTFVVLSSLLLKIAFVTLCKRSFEAELDTN